MTTAIGSLTTRDHSGNKIAGVVVSFEMIALPPSEAGNSYGQQSSFQVTSDVHGAIQATFVQLATYRMKANANSIVTFTVPGSTPFTLPDILIKFSDPQ